MRLTKVYTDHVLNQGYHILFNDVLSQAVIDNRKVYLQNSGKICDLFIVLDVFLQ